MKKVKEAIKKQFVKKKTKFSRIKARRQYMVRIQKYLIKITFEEAGLEKIWIFWNHKGHYTRSISAKITRRIDNI